MKQPSEEQMNAFIAALIRTRDIEQAYAAIESDNPERYYIILEADEASNVSLVLGKAKRSAAREADKDPNTGNKENLDFIQSVLTMFGSKTYIGGYASAKSRNAAYLRKFAEDCEKHGCD